MARVLPRLGFLCSLFVSLGLSACTASSAPEESATSSDAVERNDPEPSGVRVRIVAGNLTSGRYQSWDPGHGIRMLKGLGADVAVLQELNYGDNTDADYEEFVAAAFEPGFWYTVERRVQIPNGVVSRYPIIDQGVWADPQVSNRSFVWARIDVPGDRDLWAVSVHLLTTGAQKRQAEAAALVARLDDVVPEGDYVVIGGDFNTKSRSERCLETLGRVTRTRGPWPVDWRNNGNTNRGRSKPYDWLVVDPALHARSIPVTIGAGEYVNGFVFDSREFPELDAVEPAQRGDSNASNMQHMAVVRDFTLPATP